MRQPTEQDRARFNSYTERGENCWEWKAAHHPTGYGMFAIPDENGPWRMRRAHRVAFVLAYGTIPPQAVIAHSCDNPGCVNPQHLFACSQAENLADMTRKGRRNYGGRDKTHCSRGHPRTPENVYEYLRDGRPRRACKVCSKLRHKRTYVPAAERRAS